MNEELKRHAPTAAIAAVTIAVVAALTSRTSSPPAPIAPVIGSAATPTPSVTANAAPSPADSSSVTRLVSCGPSARIEGNDQRGRVRLDVDAMFPEGPTHNCTVLFATSSTQKLCTVTDGTIAKLTKSDLVVSGISQTFTYECR